MTSNIPIPGLPIGQDATLIVVVTSVQRGRTRQGKAYLDAVARNDSGTVPVRIWSPTLSKSGAINPGLWEISGRLEAYQNTTQFVASGYKPLTITEYRDRQRAEPPLARAYTFDIETVVRSEFRDRAPKRLKRDYERGSMRDEQRTRYEEDTASEELRLFRSGGLYGVSGRVLCIGVHAGPVAGIDIAGLDDRGTEYVFGIDAEGKEQEEWRTLREFLALLDRFDFESDELVGYNIIRFDLPFIIQRCYVLGISVGALASFLDVNSRCVFDTMRRWSAADRDYVKLDDIAWAFGLPSSKTDEIDGSRIFDLYNEGRLREIREYNLNDVRLTRKLYERMAAALRA